ncbi:MAG: hypothetical protein GEU99_16175 [Luteitalea sp.]|nr:hypothetical protein [Luteitalea sp.]
MLAVATEGVSVYTRTIAVFVACVITSLISTYAQQVPAEDRHGNTLRILSYNIKRGYGMDSKTDIGRAAAVINRLKPDLVALQEVDVGVRRSGWVDQTVELGRLTQTTPFFAEFMDHDGGKYGQGLLSRLPVLQVRRIPLPDGQEEPRASAVMRVRAFGEELTIACVHFYRTEEDRLAQARALVAAMADVEGPVVLAGDFNSRRGDPVMTLIEQSFESPVKQGPPNTFRSDNPRTEIDFIAFRPKDAFTVKEYRVVSAPVVSDHLPVLMVLERVSARLDKTPKEIR